LRRLLLVHRRGPSGSPRVTGSMRRFRSPARRRLRRHDPWPGLRAHQPASRPFISGGGYSLEPQLDLCFTLGIHAAFDHAPALDASLPGGGRSPADPYLVVRRSISSGKAGSSTTVPQTGDSIGLGAPRAVDGHGGSDHLSYLQALRRWTLTRLVKKLIPIWIIGPVSTGWAPSAST